MARVPAQSAGLRGKPQILLWKPLFSPTAFRLTSRWLERLYHYYNMAQLMVLRRKVTLSFALVTLAAACHAQAGLSTRGQNKPAQEDSANAIVPHAAEDISGMYSFVKEGEFLQISLEKTG